LVHLDRRPAERRQIDQTIQVRLRLGEQPGAAREPGIAILPRRQGVPAARPDNFGYRVQVHGCDPNGDFR
jgi:hypothetical protein